MSIRALSIDFWNTLVMAGVNGPARHSERLRFLSDISRTHNAALTDQEIESSLLGVISRFDEAWKAKHRTPQTWELVNELWESLKIDVSDEERDATIRLFQEGILHYPPALADGVAEMIPWAASRFRLGIISDTMFSPGRVIRRLLSDYGIGDCFEAFVFSDETGFSKPDARAFALAASQFGAKTEEMAHIGDLRRTDIAGAQDSGAMGILFTGIHADEGEGPVPRHTLANWAELPTLLGTL